MSNQDLNEFFNVDDFSSSSATESEEEEKSENKGEIELKELE